jgi:hypothetical protein
VTPWWYARTGASGETFDRGVRQRQRRQAIDGTGPDADHAALGHPGSDAVEKTARRVVAEGVDVLANQDLVGIEYRKELGIVVECGNAQEGEINAWLSRDALLCDGEQSLRRRVEHGDPNRASRGDLDDMTAGK